MKKNIKNVKIVEGTFGRMQEIPNFLPKPEDLVFRQPGKKIDLFLKTETIEFFKRKASRLNTEYQTMIRAILEKYVSQAK